MLSLSILPMQIAIFRLKPLDNIPSQAYKSTDFFSITRMKEALSIVCEEKLVPKEIQIERGWKCLKVERPLAEAQISIFAISTFDTDYLCVKETTLQKTIEVLGTFCKILC